MKKCNTNPIVKYIRIILSLAVIVIGIIYKNWLGIFGIFTLISAFTGSCPMTVRLGRKSDNGLPVKEHNSQVP